MNLKISQRNICSIYFLSVFYYHENLYLLYYYKNQVGFYVFIINRLTIKLFFSNKLLILSYTALYAFNTFLLYTEKFIYLLLLSSYLSHPLNWGNSMCDGTTPTLLMYPIKYSKEHFLAYEALSGITILSISTLFISTCC